MDGRQPGQRKDPGARPKEPRSKARSAYNPANDAGIARVMTESKDLGKYTSPEVENASDGLPSNRKAPKKTSRIQKTKSNPDEPNQLPIKLSTKQHVKETSAKEDKYGTASKAEIEQNNVRYPLSRSVSEGAKEKKPPKKQHTFSEEICENGQYQAKKSEKKVCDKTAKEEKAKVPNLDNGATEKKPPKKQDKPSEEIQENGQWHAKISEKKVEKAKVLNVDNEEVTSGTDGKPVNPRAQRRLKDVVSEKLTMKMGDISKAAEKVNRVVETIVKSEQFCQDSVFKGIEKMTTGSYYERVKISNPNEFDIMLNISLPTYNTITLTQLEKDGAFYTLAFKDRIPNIMLQYQNEGGDISAIKILNAFRDLVKKVIAESNLEGVSLQRKDPVSPAVTLIIQNEPQNISVDLVLALKMIGRWPEQTNNGMKIDDWLGTKVKRNYKSDNFYMVPKKAKYSPNTDTWRISFSNIEKKILTNHGNGKTCCESGREKCCRKPCLKLLKYLLELLKNNGKPKKMNQFCSYHAKTALLHYCAQNPKDEYWRSDNLEECFEGYVSFFQDCLKRYTLYNFFIPSHNLFSADHVDKSSCDYLFKEIETQKANGYPIFYD
ncbi:cyclic GMP-AMP synthase [Dendropsophus ebraccatus]|uniref:cyclic GMP-AMP synthase n=1 Tax=Dendropsophus ebraccatus TaxID=150705 RepID=UPI003831F727